MIRTASQKGFTLLGLSAAIAISGLVTAGTVSVARPYLAQKKQTEAKTNLATLQTALEDYQRKNGHYPCPSSLTAPGGAADCNSAFTTSDGKVKIGAVPARELGLPESAKLDGWNRSITYAVTFAQTQKASFQPNIGVIEIKDTAGETTLQKTNFVLVSAGPDGRGAYTPEGKLHGSCDLAAKDGQNCDFTDATFMHANARTDVIGANHYDDLIAFAGTTQIAHTCGAGEVVGGIAANGQPVCKTISAANIATQTCSSNQRMTGLNANGSPICSNIPPPPQPVYYDPGPSYSPPPSAPSLKPALPPQPGYGIYQKNGVTIQMMNYGQNFATTANNNGDAVVVRDNKGNATAYLSWEEAATGKGGFTIAGNGTSINAAAVMQQSNPPQVLPAFVVKHMQNSAASVKKK